MSLASNKTRERGSALLAVLWLSTALAAISFSVALTVRGESERVATSEEDERAYYLAQGAVERAILHVEWSQSATLHAGESPLFTVGQPRMDFNFPSGVASVEIIPEKSKLSLNDARPAFLQALLLNLGVDPERAAGIAAAIVDWRTPHSAASPTGFDQLYLSMQPSFQAAHASFQDVEELLFLPGMTPDLFYGTWVRQPVGDATRLVPVVGLRDCVSVFGSTDHFDVNTVQPAVLAAVGTPPEFIGAILERRAAAPFLKSQELAEFAGANPGLLNHVGTSPHTLYTFRATASLRRPNGSLSDLKRTVSALVKFVGPGDPQRSVHILRWYDRG